MKANFKEEIKMNPVVVEVLKEAAKVAIPIILKEAFKDDNKKSGRHPKHKNRRPNYRNKPSR